MEQILQVTKRSYSQRATPWGLNNHGAESDLRVPVSSPPLRKQKSKRGYISKIE